MKFKFLEHTADIKFQAEGKTIEEAFANAALALQEVMTKGVKVKSRINKKFEVNGKDNERLLYDFLEEFLFLLDSEDFLLSKIKSIKITKMLITGKTNNINKCKAEADEDNNGRLYNHKLTAEIIGDDADNYNFTNNAKAITYNEMFVKKKKIGKGKFKYVCQVVVDVWMGLVRTQKVGEGMHISGRNRDIYIILIKICGEEFHRKAEFSVWGVKGLNKLELSADEGYVNLTEDIKIEIGNAADLREDFISINYHAPNYYAFTRREYQDLRKRKNNLAKKIINVNHPVGFYFKQR